jgi:type I restriction enzyme M protein
MSEAQKKILQQQLRNIANELRWKMDADEFRDYILWFIFYKYLSEKLELYANSLEDDFDYKNIDEKSNYGETIISAVKQEALNSLWYFLLPSELFGKVAEAGSKGIFILEDLGRILNNIESSTMGTESEDDFNNLFSDLDLGSQKLGKTANDKNTLISKVLVHLDKIDFQLENSKIDVLGDAYEYLIQQFAAWAGKKAGEFYTPQEVSEVLSRLVTVGKKKLKSVYDPTCGSGSLLLRVAKQVEEVGKFYGQEMNNTTYNLCRMNMILHGVHFTKFAIHQEDTLKRPAHLEEQFEAIVANPPFSAQWSANHTYLSDDRFSQYGRLAPKGYADYAFIQHMIYQLAENGTMATVMPHGVLFRWWAEGHIREYLIKEKNYLDAVIGLPANIFYGTSIPTSILVFKKCRTHPDNVLFIDASKWFEKVKNQNVLREEHIEKIIMTYKDRITIDKYSYVAPLSELEENEYNLNIPRYVDTFEEEEQIDLDAVALQIREITKQMKATDSVIAWFCKELGIKSPF